jgi:hypothetical protein
MAQHVSLQAHPQSPTAVVKEILASVYRPLPAKLQLDYLVRGDIAQLLVPQAAQADRQDELWQHTCAELFVATVNEDAYYEFNFSPSSQWAAYEFTGYRSGMRSLLSAAPLITCRQTASELLLQVTVELPPTAVNVSGALELSLSMVIEETNAMRSYWSLIHPTPQPDFHQRAGFIVHL